MHDSGIHVCRVWQLAHYAILLSVILDERTGFPMKSHIFIHV